MRTNVTYRMAWSVAEVANLTGLSLGFLRKEIKNGQLTAHKKGRRVVILTRDLEQYLEEGVKTNG